MPTYSSCTNFPVFSWTVERSSSSKDVPASSRRSFMILSAIPSTLVASSSGDVSPGAFGAPPRASLSCVATNSSNAKKAMYNGMRESGNVRVCAAVGQHALLRHRREGSIPIDLALSPHLILWPGVATWKGRPLTNLI